MKKNIGLLILITSIGLGIFGVPNADSSQLQKNPMSAQEVRDAGLAFYSAKEVDHEILKTQFPNKSAVDLDRIFISITEYMASTGGNCPCPWNKAKNDSGCGKRSAYYRSGGHEPFCYPLN